MEIIIILAVVFVGAFLIAYFLKQRKSLRGPSQSRLYKELQKQLHLPPDQAEEYIDDFVERMRQKYPGHTREWYLEKILFDLKRDRR